MSAMSIRRKGNEYKAPLQNTHFNTWRRPLDWLQLPTVGATDQKIVGLVAIFPQDCNYYAFIANGAYTVDWGDGTPIENIANGVKAQHRYEWSAISDTTLTSTGYRQAIITITPQSGQTLSGFNMQQFHSEVNQTSGFQNWLDLKIGLQGTGLAISNWISIQCMFPMLKQIVIENFGSTLSSTLFYFGSMAVAKFALNKPNVTIAGSSPFRNAHSLEEVVLHPSTTASNCASLFNLCYNLRTVTYFNTDATTDFSSMFNGCTSLEEVPLFNTSAGTNFSSMLAGCRSLKKIPTFDTANGTNFSSMFNACTSLKEVPLLNLTKATTAANMFQDCLSLNQVPVFNVPVLTTTTSMFQNCSSLKYIPNINFNSVTSAGSMFSGCTSLIRIDATFGTLSVITSFINSCLLLENLPGFTSSGTLATSFSSQNYCLEETGVVNINSLTGSLPLSNTKLRYADIRSPRASLSFSNNMLDQENINRAIENLGLPAATQTLTITGNPGANKYPARSVSSTTTAGSTTITTANTNDFFVGMQVTGTGISDSRAVTLQDSADTVTLAGHGIPNGKLVSFATLVTTTGIVVYRPYYVVNATADTFQLSLTENGSPVALTTDGSGTIIYQTLVTAIDPGVSVVVDIPPSASGTNTLIYRHLNTQIAVMKRWAVTG